MKKLKSSEPLDRLSELPDSLIFDIFDYLPMTGVVRTSILSRRWRNLWTTVPNLDFVESVNNFDRDKFRIFVNRALLRWRGTRVHKFEVSCDDDYVDSDDDDENSLVADADSWLRFAIDNGVEDLIVSYYHYSVPQCVYSCSSLKKLFLNWCDLEINGNVHWNRLKSLAIVECYGVTQHMIDQILCESPLLEVFKLSLVQNDDNSYLSFGSTSLKELSICRNERSNTSKYSVLRIWTPNLETLTILGIDSSKYALDNVSSLTHATLGFRDDLFHREFIGFPFHDILPSIQQVKSLTLLDWRSKMIGTKRICLLPNVKFLKLGIVKKHQDVVRLLENFPNIKTLVLQENDYVIDQFNAKSCQEDKPDDPSGPFLTELVTMEVTWNGSDFSIFPLIKTLLRNASKLTKMVFRVKDLKQPSPPSNSMLLASQKLLRMQRSYPNVELILCEG